MSQVQAMDRANIFGFWKIQILRPILNDMIKDRVPKILIWYLKEWMEREPYQHANTVFKANT